MKIVCFYAKNEGYVRTGTECDDASSIAQNKKGVDSSPNHGIGFCLYSSWI